MAMGVAAPAQSGPRHEDAAASAAGLDTALVGALARRARVRGTGAALDGQPPHERSGPFILFHPLWLASEPSFPPPLPPAGRALVPSRLRPPLAPLVAARSSRGPPPFVTL